MPDKEIDVDEMLRNLPMPVAKEVTVVNKKKKIKDESIEDILDFLKSEGMKEPGGDFTPPVPITGQF